MSSPKQLVANRANAKKSTGPKTDAGKARSRMNAYKHGLTGEKVVAACEDPAAFNALRIGLWEQYHPAPGVESALVDRLASLIWRLNRIPIMETTFFHTEIVFDYVENEYLPQLRAMKALSSPGSTGLCSSCLSCKSGGSQKKKLPAPSMSCLKRAKTTLPDPGIGST